MIIVIVAVESYGTAQSTLFSWKEAVLEVLEHIYQIRENLEANALPTVLSQPFHFL